MIYIITFIVLVIFVVLYSCVICAKRADTAEREYFAQKL